MRYKHGGMPAASLDQFGDASASELAESGVAGKSARSPRPLRIPVNLITSFKIVGKIGGAVGDGFAVRRGIGNECVSAIERHVQPLVAIHRP